MQKKNTVKIMFNFRFIGLLCIAFLLQHFSFATFQNNLGFNHLNSGIAQNNYFEKGSSEHQDLQLHLFVEAESEDEDDVHNKESDCNEFISSCQNSKIYRYTEAINKLSLKLVSTNQHKVDLPFFILYHSWKSHLA
jgi:hypothetical protein